MCLRCLFERVCLLLLIWCFGGLWVVVLFVFVFSCFLYCVFVVVVVVVVLGGLLCSSMCCYVCLALFFLFNCRVFVALYCVDALFVVLFVFVVGGVVRFVIVFCDFR